MRASVWAFFALFSTVAIPSGRAQAVISTRSGVVHFFEGAVYLSDRPLESHFGKYSSIPEGSELRTERGRAEVLLTPGVFLRVGENAAIRMVANSLADTRVELLAGSAIVDSLDPTAGTAVTVIYKSWKMRPVRKGVFRLDCDPARLLVREGDVEVSTAADTPGVSVAQGMELPLAAVLVPEKAANESRDAFGDWANGRAESIAADNAIASNIQDPASMSASGLPADGVTYFPMLGVPFYGPGVSGYSGYNLTNPYQSGPYGVVTLYQPGFSSSYLPGYNHSPLLLGLLGARLPHASLPPLRGVSGPYHPPAQSPIVRPGAVHSGPRGGTRGGHR
jgi:hypothetical protein